MIQLGTLGYELNCDTTPLQARGSAPPYNINYGGAGWTQNLRKSPGEFFLLSLIHTGLPYIYYIDPVSPWNSPYYINVIDDLDYGEK